jgi:putative transposase
MTEERVILAELLEKAGEGDFLRAVAEAVLQLLMETDVEGLIGAGRYERSGERTTWRNSYRDRTLDTRLGALQLRIPKLRQGSYFPPFLEARKSSERALVAVIQEAWIGGVSTRRVDDLVQAMGLSGISKSQVSKLCKEIDERVHVFLDRPLAGEWPYLWLDATYLKQREGGRIVAVAAIIAVAANTDGRREIVGLQIGPSEAETFWSSFLKSLARRGLRGVKLVISDAHEGLKAAVRRVFSAGWQRCRVHWMRNALAYVPMTQQSMVAAAVRQAFLQPDRAQASQTLRHVADQLRPKWPKLAAFIDDSETEVLSYLDFPEPHRSKIAQHQPARAAQQGSQAPGRRGRHLPQRSRNHSADRRGIARAKRRVAAAAPLHAGRSHGRADRRRRWRPAADPMRGLALERSTAASKAWMPNARPQCRCQAPQPRSGAPKAQGLIAGLRPQHNRPCRRSRPSRRTDRNRFFTKAAAPVAPQLQSQISTSLTDVTAECLKTLHTPSWARPASPRCLG